MSEETDRLYATALIVDEQLRIIKDRYGLFSEVKAERDAALKLLANTPPDLALARAELAEMQREIDRLTVLRFQLEAQLAQLWSAHNAQNLTLHAAECAVEDLNVQAKFWRQAAEHAVEGWNKLEDKYEDLLTRVRVLLRSEPQDVDSEAWRQLEIFEDTREEWAPPTPVADPAPGLHVVEDEKPL